MHKTGDDTIVMYLRSDKKLIDIVRSVVLSITRRTVFEEYKGLWGESQVLAEWLVRETPLRDVLISHGCNLDSALLIPATRTSSLVGNQRTDKDYYIKLGVPVFNKGFHKNETGQLLFENKRLKGLSIAEKKLLELFIAKKPDIVSVDEIADYMFKKDDDFSLYAISKAVQRLRDALEFNGISGSHITTIRNKGFSLKC
jgi:DNA-binding winged helix-turn-helix (wHTH) protein